MNPFENLGNDDNPALLSFPLTDIPPIEKILPEFYHLEQFVDKIINYSSKYSVNGSIMYCPENLMGRYEKYPSYGDFPETYTLRSYGNWMKESEAYQQNYMPQEVDPYGAEDFITFGFQMGVVPRQICIYETYNPGAVVRIWGRFNRGLWKLLWEGQPQNCPEEARKFQISIEKINNIINEIRLEINQSHLKYHTSLDAVLLGGIQPKSDIHFNILSKNLLEKVFAKSKKPETTPESGSEIGIDYFSSLPHEVIIQIFQHLDLLSLSRCAQVNRAWYQTTRDPILYQNLSLKRYWHKVNEDTFCYLKARCRGLKKLDLSWCGNESRSFGEALSSFLEQRCRQLTHLSLCHCELSYSLISEQIPLCTKLTELRLANAKADNEQLLLLSNLKKLITLDVSLTSINENTLTSILKANVYLKHLILDFCENMSRLDQVVETVSTYNKDFKTWSSFKTPSLTSVGAGYFARCSNLTELDLGWCFIFFGIGDGLLKIANGCPKLKRLILSQCKEVNDAMLLPVITNCKELTQIDLLGIKNVTSELCRAALANLQKLRLLDISFCDSISSDLVDLWRLQYPHVTIQRSCQYVVVDYLSYLSL